MLDFKIENTDVWESLTSSTLPVVIYGTGNGADKVLDELERLCFSPSAIFASDGFVRNRQFRGYPVLSYNQIKEIYGDFTVAVSFASSLENVIENIKKISAEHTTLVPCVPVYGTKILNKEFIREFKNELNEAYNLMADDESKRVFAGAVNFQLSGKLDYLWNITSSREDAFDKILRLGQDECYVDLGAYKGDTVDEFLFFSKGKYNHITALEPNLKVYRKLCENCRQLNNTALINGAIWNKKTEMLFDNKAGRGAHTSEGNSMVECYTIDEICADVTPTYIKMDVEGAEYEALLGGADTIKKYKPKLNIAAYHRCEDIFKLPLLIKSLNPDYKIYLRKHPYIPCWDMNLYCR